MAAAKRAAILKRPLFSALGKRSQLMTSTISGKSDSNRNLPERDGDGVLSSGQSSSNSGTRRPAPPPVRAVRSAASARDQVMIEYQRTALEMASKFLESQQRVMLAYLGQSFSAPSETGSIGLPFQVPAPSDSRDVPDLAARQLFQSLPAARDTQNESVAYQSVDEPYEAEVLELQPTANAESEASALPALTPGSAAETSGASSVIDSDYLISSLIEIVSERTGYPPEMLDPTLDLEADLGIDSIKRVEILNTFRKLLPESVQHSLEDGIEKLAGVKTLQGIIDWIRTDLSDTISGDGPQLAGVALDSSMVAALRAADIDMPANLQSEVSALPHPSGVRLHSAQTKPGPNGQVQFWLPMGTESDYFLKDHTFDGVPVMPMAMALELMCEAARSQYPELVVANVTDMEIPAGIVFDTTKDIVVALEPAQSRGASTVVRVSVCTQTTFLRPHFKATLELCTRPDTHTWPATLPKKWDPAVSFANAIDAPSASSIYEEIMFHGPLFQGVTGVRAMGSNGICGDLRATDTERLIASPGQTDWELHPVLLDSAMQLAGVWGRKFLDVMLLPAGFAVLRKLRPMLEKQYTAVVSIPEHTSGIEIRCDLAVYAADGEPVLLLEGLKGIGTKSLNRLSKK